MARMPGALWQGEKSPRTPMSRYDVVCLHTIVGYAPAHAAHFSVKADGTIQQSRDTAYRSAANLDGNHRVISIENEDHGSAFGSWNTRDGHAVPDFTSEQIEANAKILAWAHKTHGVPLQLCPNSRPTSRGLGYHRQGIDGNFGSYRYPGRVSGGEVWTSSPGKVCPGDQRISRRQQILDRAKQIVNGDDHMSAADVAELKKYIDRNTVSKIEVAELVKKYAVGPTEFERSHDDIAEAVASALLNHENPYGRDVNGVRPTVEQQLGRIDKRTKVSQDILTKPAELAQAIVTQLGGSADVAKVEQAIRGVLGELDDDA